MLVTSEHAAGLSDTGAHPDLLRKVVLVTGSSRGIGAAVARGFAANGAWVAVHGRDSNALAGIVEEIGRAGSRVMQVRGDVTRFDELEVMRRQIEEGLGPIDISGR